MAKRRYPASEVSGAGQGWRPGGATRGAVAAQAQEGLEELSHIEGQEWRRKEIPLIQGKEQWLCFAGAAM